ncbi:unnamed protein product, partial [Medioppia subpectinata]
MRFLVAVTLLASLGSISVTSVKARTMEIKINDDGSSTDGNYGGPSWGTSGGGGSSWGSRSSWSSTSGTSGPIPFGTTGDNGDINVQINGDPSMGTPMGATHGTSWTSSSGTSMVPTRTGSNRRIVLDINGGDGGPPPVPTSTSWGSSTSWSSTSRTTGGGMPGGGVEPAWTPGERRTITITINGVENEVETVGSGRDNGGTPINSEPGQSAGYIATNGFVYNAIDKLIGYMEPDGDTACDYRTNQVIGFKKLYILDRDKKNKRCTSVTSWSTTSTTRATGGGRSHTITITVDGVPTQAPTTGVPSGVHIYNAAGQQSGYVYNSFIYNFNNKIIGYMDNDGNTARYKDNNQIIGYKTITSLNPNDPNGPDGPSGPGRPGRSTTITIPMNDPYGPNGPNDQNGPEGPNGP